MRERAKERRRTLIVDARTQKRILAAVVTPPTVGLGVATLIVAVYCRRLAGEAMLADAELPSLVPLFGWVLFLFVVATGLIVFRGLRLSHRIAGPAHNIRRSVQCLREGELSVRIRLRRGDFLTELAEELNGLIEDLEKRSEEGDPVPVARPAERTAGPAPEVVQARRIPSEGPSIPLHPC